MINEYLFKCIKDDLYATVSVGKLVNSNYLNTVINQRIEKNISNCSIVKVSKKNNDLTANFDESTINKKDINYINNLDKASFFC